MSLVMFFLVGIGLLLFVLVCLVPLVIVLHLFASRPVGVTIPDLLQAPAISYIKRRHVLKVEDAKRAQRAAVDQAIKEIDEVFAEVLDDDGNLRPLTDDGPEP